MTSATAKAEWMLTALAGEEPWKGAWGRLRAAKHSAFDFQPEPFVPSGRVKK
jgi:hypothetical protein